MQFNADDNDKESDFVFWIKEGVREKFSIINPAPVSFMPDELKLPERSSLGTIPEDTLHNVQMEFKLIGLKEFGWIIKIESKTNELITINDFHFELKTNDAGPPYSRKINPVDYLNIYPFGLPAGTALLGILLYNIIQYLIKKI